MKKQTNILIIVLLVLLTAAGGVIAWLVTHRPDPLALEPNVVALTPTPAGLANGVVKRIEPDYSLF